MKLFPPTNTANNNDKAVKFNLEMRINHIKLHYCSFWLLVQSWLMSLDLKGLRVNDVLVQFLFLIPGAQWQV